MLFLIQYSKNSKISFFLRGHIFEQLKVQNARKQQESRSFDVYLTIFQEEIIFFLEFSKKYQFSVTLLVFCWSAGILLFISCYSAVAAVTAYQLKWNLCDQSGIFGQKYKLCLFSLYYFKKSSVCVHRKL